MNPVISALLAAPVMTPDEPAAMRRTGCTSRWQRCSANLPLGRRRREDGMNSLGNRWRASTRGRLAQALVLTLALTGAAFAARAAERALDKEVLVAASVDQLWDAWTTREGITSFFSPDARIDGRVGGAFQIYMDPGAEPGLKGADDMRYLALQPKRMLSFDWNAPPHLAEARQQRTFVIVRFEPASEQSTKVTLHHVGWGDGGEWDETFAYFDRAWGFVLANLKLRFEKGPMDWKPWLEQLQKARTAARKP